MKYNLISLKIKKYRQTLGITQEELAKKLQVALGTIKFYEAGTRVPSPKIKRKLCDIFKITLEELEGKSEKLELKERIISTFNNFHITNNQFESIIELVCNFWEKCYALNGDDTCLSNETLKLFTIKGNKKCPEVIKVNKNLIVDDRNDNISNDILDISENIINIIIDFFYTYLLHDKYKDIILRGIVLDYESYILLKLCIFNNDLTTQVLKEITLESNTTRYLVPVVSNFNENFEENLNNITNFIELPFSMKNEKIKHIAIKITNDEMAFKYEHGDIIIIQLQSCFNNAQDVLVKINDQSTIVRRIIQNENGIILQPLNTNYYPQIFTKAELKSGKFKILGVVVAVLINQDI